MIRALCFNNTDMSVYSNDSVLFQKFSTDNSVEFYVDIVILDENSRDLFEEHNCKFQKNVYKIIVVDEEPNCIDAQTKYDAWILADKIENIHKLIKAGMDRIKMAKELDSSNKILMQMFADNEIKEKSYELVLLNLKKATAQVKSIFEKQVDEMKSIHSDIKNIRLHLQDEYSPPSCSDVVGAAKQTDMLLSRTDDVIKAMFGFIRILQCEDRLTQMLDGLKNLLNLENDLITQHGISLSRSDLLLLTSSLETLFTIQEQRDIAKGLDDLESMISCGDITESEPEEIELF